MNAIPARLSAAMLAAVAILATGPAAAQTFYGYAEGEYARLAPREGGILEELHVKRGGRVKAGDVVAQLESGDEVARLNEARARLAQAEAQLADLRKGKRTPEVDTLIAQRAQAEATLRLSEAQFARQMRLPAGEVVSEEKLDQSRSAVERDRARVVELVAQIATARLAARDDEIDAAVAAVQATRAQLAQADWRLGQRRLLAPAPALVNDTLFVAGEYVPAGTPVVSLLPDGNVKLRFFVPEPELARVRIGQEVAFRCDGCAQGLKATIVYIAPGAEYTPPVIYSRETRAKLVFMVEARPAPGARLNPGQPVEVTAGKP
jgi:HlyD family secretion protein